MSMPAIVLHVCCAPCASACLERLALEGFRAVLFFSNANIAPRAERDHRLHEVFRLAKLSNSRLEVDDIQLGSLGKSIMDKKQNSGDRQLSLDSFRPMELVEEIQALDVMSMSPIEALNTLFTLCEKARRL